MKTTLTLPTPYAGRSAWRRVSLLDVCSALLLTLAGLLGREGLPNGE